MTGNAKYTFSIETTERLAVHPKSTLHTVIVSDVATNPDGVKLNFVATNNLDMRYPDRFKVNWNGNKARMPEVVGHGSWSQSGRRFVHDSRCSHRNRTEGKGSCPPPRQPGSSSCRIRGADKNEINRFGRS